MKRRSLVWLLAAVTLSVLVLTSPAARAVGDLSSSAYESLRIFTRVLALVETKYVEEVDVKDLVYKAINGMLAGLDPHSSFMTPEELKELTADTMGRFGGLGIEIAVKDGYIGVISPIDDTPADRAGIKAGDLIVKIDGESTKGMSIMDAVGKLRGQPGTKVTISVFRDGFDKPQDFTIERAVIEVKTVKSRILEPGYGYLKLAQFNIQAKSEIVKAVKAMDKGENGLKGLVLDLRNNPGGLLDQAVAVADEFLNDGLIVYTRGRMENQNMSFSADPGGVYTAGPLVVLVNGGSASASEILAGALQDQHRGVLVGTRTFGKGSVQTVMNLEGGTAVKLTTAKYFTPEGHDIQAKGIVPDFILGADEYAGMEKDQVKFFREKELRNRLKNVDEEKKGDKPAAIPGMDDEEGGDVKSEEIKDYQLELGLSVLKSWQTFQKVGAR